MFSNVVVSALAFLLALGILISIHEYGHFWVARRVGIKVLRYSIGFGKALFRWVGRVDDTEYVVAAIPLGGYVKMLDEREGSVETAERHRAFNQQPLWARSAVVVAGPLANLLLAVFAYWIVMMIGISGVAPLVGAPQPDSAAERAGFRYEDRILSVNGQVTPTWADARIALLESSLSGDASLGIEVQSAAGEQLTRTLDVRQADVLKAEGDAIANLGFRTWWPEVDPIIGEVLPDGAAASAGLKAGDRILRIDGEPLSSWRDLVQRVRPSAGVSLELLVARDGDQLVLQLIPDPVEIGGTTVGRIGVMENQSAELADKARVTVQYSPVAAFGQALERTWDMSLLTVRMMGKLILGQASLENVSGPISIAQYAGQSVSIGVDHYINFIAIISISLAVLNLLPIPMLDGGHLLYFMIEAIRGRPLSERSQLLGQQVGIAILGALMFLAFYNDLWRLFQ